jgi:hypothetical protein
VTDLQRKVACKVGAATMRNEWYRAESSGERITLASLLRAGVVVRQVWRARTRDTNAAHEYQLAAAVIAALKEAP